MSEILFLSHRIPFPPDRGDKIRSHHLLQRLARLAPVHVATFVDDEADAEHEVDLAVLARSFHLARRSKPLALAAAEAFARGRPVSLPAFADAGLRRYVAATLASRPIATIFVFSSQMSQYVPDDFRGRVVMDFVDVDSAKFEAYAAGAAIPLRQVFAREARLLAAVEAGAARRADVSLFVSEPEAALFRSRLDRATLAAADVRVLGNGIDGRHFDPIAVEPEPLVRLHPGPHLMFCGQMDYLPNVAAVTRFAARVLPAIRAARPEVRFHVVGRRPAPEVLALDGRDGCRVWGRVPDTRPFLAAADLVVVPLEIARGVQNKVLEAMAMARPLLLSPAAATGIAGDDGVHFAIGEGDRQLAERALALLADPAGARELGRAGRRCAVERYGWATKLAELPEIVGLTFGARRAA